MDKERMGLLAEERGMTLKDYQIWLDDQLKDLDFDSDNIPADVAEYASHIYGFEQITREEMEKNGE